MQRPSNIKYPKIVIMDLEGTLFLKKRRLVDGEVAPSAWTVLADRLGSRCLAEEKETWGRWNRCEYSGYVEWMRDTIRIHKKYGLTRDVFEEVINGVKFTPGVRKAVAEFRKFGAITAIVTGGFKALADRAQLYLRVDHALSACEYFFNEKTGRIDYFNLLPSDERGKVNFVKLIAQEHGIDLEDCAFVGDGKNDAHIARVVGFSVAFNAQPELRRVASISIEQSTGRESFSSVAEAIRKHFPRRRRRASRKNASIRKKVVETK
jgi:phosphoserine phosphatase